MLPEVRLPSDLPCVAAPVFWWHDVSPRVQAAEPRDLGGGWWGYEDGAAYNPARDWTYRR
jgi:hypothetical protein